MRETKRLREPDYDWLTRPGQAAYIAALHKEVVESKGRDFCTGTPQQWRLLAPSSPDYGAARIHIRRSRPQHRLCLWHPQPAVLDIRGKRQCRQGAPDGQL